MPAHKRQRQEDYCKSENSLGYTVTLCLKTKTKTNQTPKQNSPKSPNNTTQPQTQTKPKLLDKGLGLGSTWKASSGYQLSLSPTQKLGVERLNEGLANGQGWEHQNNGLLFLVPRALCLCGEIMGPRFTGYRPRACRSPDSPEPV